MEYTNKINALRDDCEKYFNTRNFHEVLKISKDASKEEIKKAYLKLSLQIHPDKVEEKEKEICTEKFKVLNKVYWTLYHPEKIHEENVENVKKEFEATFFEMFGSVFSNSNVWGSLLIFLGVAGVGVGTYMLLKNATKEKNEVQVSKQSSSSMNNKGKRKMQSNDTPNKHAKK